MLSKNVINDGKKPPSEEHIWLYSGRTYGWWMYEDRIIAQLESGWREYMKHSSNSIKEINIGGVNIKADYRRMEQTNIRTGLIRNMRRIRGREISHFQINGVSGIPHKKNNT